MDVARRRKLMKKLDVYGLTRFQKKVLGATLCIPRGEVRTYRQIAEAVGSPRAYRAVGTALKNNPLAPLIPCHRVIRSNGELGEYSGLGGTRRKMKLLKKESAI